MNFREFLESRNIEYKARGGRKVIIERAFNREALLLMNEHNFNPLETEWMLLTCLEIPESGMIPDIALCRKQLKESFLLDMVKGKFVEYYGCWLNTETNEYVPQRSAIDIFNGVEFKKIADYRKEGLVLADLFKEV